MEKPFPVERVKAALLAIRPKVSEPQMSMLRAHYLYRTLSMERIANFGGYGEYRAGNSQYGTLCGNIARELGFDSPGAQTYTIAESVERDENGDAQWRMDDVATKAIEQAGWFSQVAAEKPEPMQPREVTETEREALIKARVGQGNFRTDVIALWGCCAVTGCSLSKILVASHIVPWTSCETNQERLDAFNGLLLTPNLDKLVDRCLIAFNDDGSILLSKELTAEERVLLGVSEKTKLRFVRPAMLPYLQRHRGIFLEKTTL
jgi:HNH endonuclease